MPRCSSKKKIVIVSNGDSLASLAMAKLSFDNDEYEVAGVVCVNTTFSRKRSLLWHAIRKRSFYYAVYIQLEVIAAKIRLNLMRKRRDSNSGIEINRLIEDGRAPYITTNNINEKKTIEFVGSLGADIVLSIRPGQIFNSQTVRCLPKIMNIHCSLLPRHAGIGGVLQALSSGDSETGVTVHYIVDEKIDGGPIIFQDVMSIDRGQSVLWHTLRLYELAASTLVTALRKEISGSVLTRENIGGTYNSWPGDEVKNQLRKNGYRLYHLSDFLDNKS